MMVHAKSCETVSTFVKAMQKKNVASFFPDRVYNSNRISLQSTAMSGGSDVLKTGI